MTLSDRIEQLSGPSREVDYADIYRKAHPRMFPHSPFERQRQLADLWPVDQEKFKRIVDASLRARGEV